MIASNQLFQRCPVQTKLNIQCKNFLPLDYLHKHIQIWITTRSSTVPCNFLIRCTFTFHQMLIVLSFNVSCLSKFSTKQLQIAKILSYYTHTVRPLSQNPLTPIYNYPIVILPLSFAQFFIYLMEVFCVWVCVHVCAHVCTGTCCYFLLQETNPQVFY